MHEEANAASLMPLIVGILVVEVLLAIALRWFTQRYPRSVAAQGYNAREALRSIQRVQSQPFRKLLTHADLPRLQLKMGSTVFAQTDVRERVARFLDAVLAMNGSSCLQRGFCLVAEGRNANTLAEDLLPILDTLEGDASIACATGVLKCVTQAVIGPFAIAAKRASQKFPFNSVPNTWVCCVVPDSDENHIIVRHEKSETGRPPHNFTFQWCVEIHVSRATGNVVRCSARVTEVSCADASVVRGLQRLFEQ